MSEIGHQNDWFAFFCWSNTSRPYLLVRPCWTHKSWGSQRYQVLALFSPFAVMGVWRHGFHTLDNLRGQKKRNRHDLKKPRGLGMCQEKAKGELLNASDSWLTKGNEITKAVQNGTSGSLETFIPALRLNIYQLLCKQLSPFKHSFWNGSSSAGHLCDETLRLVNSKV